MKLPTAVRSAALAAAVLAVTSCGLGSHSPTSPDCVEVAGAWDGSFTNSCGGSGTGPVVVSQLGCSFTALIPGFAGGTVSGSIDGRYASFTLYFSAPCSGSATGSATVDRTSIHGTYSGGANGPGCCNPVTGAFTLSR